MARPTASELLYWFDLTRPGQPMGSKTLSDQRIGYGTQFARMGDLNGSGLPVWEPTQHRNGRVSLPYHRRRCPGFGLCPRHACGFWGELLGQYSAASARCELSSGGG